MTGKLYKYNNSWVSYGYLHDTLGYTDAPSFDISYKSTNPWGGMDTTGYMSATDFYDIRTYELWKQGLVGWYSMDEMAAQGVYPDTATETMMRNGNITSNAAYITDPNGVDYYIIQAAISEGWLTLDEWALLGWEPGGVVKYSYVVLDEDTGEILHSEFETGLQCVETSFVLLPDEPLVIIELVPQMYDVWIETVDVANNVVIALRSVFTGLTATRANTIVNNAPTYLSRYNSYLNNQGGPYTQADAVTMRDSLQSRIPAGDTSTFGIRPVST